MKHRNKIPGKYTAMLLTICPVVFMAIFAIDTGALYGLLVKPGEEDGGSGRITLQRALRLAMICCMALHLLVMLAILATVRPAEYLDEDSISYSPLTLHFEYLCQHTLRSIGILCLNAGLFIISEMETPNAMARQASVYFYMLVRTVGVILFHLRANVDLPAKVTRLEAFLAIEAVAVVVLFIVLSGRLVRIRRRLRDSGIAGRSSVESVLNTAAGSSITLAKCLLMNGLLRAGAMVVSAKPPSLLITAMREAVNAPRIIDHALFIHVTIAFLFMDIPTRDLERAGVEFRSLHCDERKVK